MSISANLFAGMSFRLFSVFLMLRPKSVTQDQQFLFQFFNSDVHAPILLRPGSEEWAQR